jgi:hypothetical protein
MESFTVNIKYNANFFERLLWKKRLKNFNEIILPTDWKDLTADQLANVAAVLFTKNDEADAMAELFVKLTGLNKWQLLYLNIDEVYSFMKPCLDFIKKPILIELPIIKAIPNSGKFGPRELMQGLCWKQFALAEALVNDFTENKDMTMLDSLCALLYCTKENPTQDEWYLGMQEAEQTRLEKIYAGMPLKNKQAVYLNYLGLKRHMAQSGVFKYMYPNSDKPLLSNCDNKKEAIDWHAVTISLAGGKFGTLQELYYTSAFDVLKHLDMESKNK